jgi:hypothetical protein
LYISFVQKFAVMARFVESEMGALRAEMWLPLFCYASFFPSA